MRASTCLLLLAVAGLAGCWPYLPNGSVPAELSGEGSSDLDSSDPDGPDGQDSEEHDDPGVDPSWDSVCAPGPQDLGPWAAHPLSGTSLRANPYANDAGLADVAAAARGETAGRAVDLVISGAVVTATAYAPAGPSGFQSFWLADSSGSLLAFQIDLPFDPSSLQPGDVVDMRVTEVKDYFGILEITGGQVQIVDEGAPVFVADAMDGEPLMYGDHPQELVEVWGELVSGPDDCGWDCFELDHGADRPVTLRARSGLLEAGACVHVIAPLDVFQSEPQLDLDRDDWVRSF